MEYLTRATADSLEDEAPLPDVFAPAVAVNFKQCVRPCLGLWVRSKKFKTGQS